MRQNYKNSLNDRTFLRHRRINVQAKITFLDHLLFQRRKLKKVRAFYFARKKTKIDKNDLYFKERRNKLTQRKLFHFDPWLFH